MKNDKNDKNDTKKNDKKQETMRNENVLQWLILRSGYEIER
tara:strand:+ start:510 stop:632 length:123 start_codon:yes stop_codon:yes gene_type:complete